MKFLSVSIFILLLFACNPKIADSSKSEPIEPPEFAELAIDSIHPEVEIDTLPEEIVTEEIDDGVVEIENILTFEKTACFGKCPAFSVELFSNGKIYYEGNAFVEKLGAYESFVTDSFIYIIFQEAEKIGFFELNEKYPTEGDFIPDLPKTITFIKNGTKQHQVINSFGSPKELQNFEEFIWNKLNELHWTKVELED